MSAVPEIPEEPTLADIALHLRALHDCVHDQHIIATMQTQQTYKELREHRHESRNNATKVQAQFHDLGQRVSNTEGQLKIIGRTVGAPATSSSAGAVGLKFMNLKWWQALLGLGGALAAGTAGYKIVATAAIAFHHAMMGGG